MSGHTATRLKAGDRVLVETIVESVFDGVSNWPVKILLDHGDSETIDASRNVHYSAIHPLSDSHADLVRALEEIAAFNITPDTGASVAMQMRRTATAALATLTARKVG